MNFVVHPFFDPETSSYSYVVANPGSGSCAVIDPVLEYDPATGTVGTAGADRIVELVEANGYCASWILETHVHADHLSAAGYLKKRLLCAQTGTGERVRDVQARCVADLGVHSATDGRQFDRLLADGDRICLGHACGRVLHTPGHTPGCVTYLFDRFAFIGDTLFMPDYGTARCDFPGGDAAALYRSVQKLYALPGDTRLLMCHDYAPGGRGYRFWTTVAEQRRSNCMLGAATTLDEFVAARQARDASLRPPKLFEASLRCNLEAGALPCFRQDSGNTRRRSPAARAAQRRPRAAGGLPSGAACAAPGLRWRR